MPRVGLTPARVLDAALAIVDSDGLDGLTLSAIAARTGVAAPSLYKHVASLAELRSLVAARLLDEMTAQLTAAVVGRSGDDAVGALMRATREYVTAHPTRYAAIPPDPLRNPVTATAGARLMDVFLGVLRGYGLEGSAAVHATRRLRAVVHGFASIEASGGFGLPEDLDETYERIITMLTRSLSH